VQRATAQSKTWIFRDYCVAEAPPGFQAGCSDCMYFFSLFLFIWLKSRTFWEIKLTFVFLSLDSIPSQLYRHHYALSSICRPQVWGAYEGRSCNNRSEVHLPTGKRGKHAPFFVFCIQIGADRLPEEGQATQKTRASRGTPSLSVSYLFLRGLVCLNSLPPCIK
jgi:hypothetical protein